MGDKGRSESEEDVERIHKDQYAALNQMPRAAHEQSEEDRELSPLGKNRSEKSLEHHGANLYKDMPASWNIAGVWRHGVALRTNHSACNARAMERIDTYPIAGIDSFGELVGVARGYGQFSTQGKRGHVDS